MGQKFSGKQICECGYITDDMDVAAQHTLESHPDLWKDEDRFRPMTEQELDELEAKAWEEGSHLQCEDCQQDRDNCPDCDAGSLYRSPDDYEKYEER
jgi:hypothetical protein